MRTTPPPPAVILRLPDGSRLKSVQPLGPPDHSFPLREGAAPARPGSPLPERWRAALARAGQRWAERQEPEPPAGPPADLRRSVRRMHLAILAEWLQAEALEELARHRNVERDPELFGHLVRAHQGLKELLAAVDRELEISGR